jgi:Spy/CpxP family protein refolding chaperone
VKAERWPEIDPGGGKMITKRKKVAIGLALAVGMVLSAAVSFGHGMRSRGGDGVGPFGEFSGRLVDRLGIQGEQKAKVQELFAKYRPEAEPVVKQVVAERRGLRRMVQGGTADEAAIRGQSARVASLESDLSVLHARFSRDFRSLLTPEQTARLAELQAKREKRGDRFLERGSREKGREKR